MVLEFLTRGFPSCQNGETLTIFIEPQIESRYPDIVAVYWRPALTRAWPIERLILDYHDFRWLQRIRTTERQELIEGEDFKPKLADVRRLDRLNKAGLLDRDNNKWMSKSLSEVYATTRILAVEAKMSFTEEGLDQAFRNTWFSDETYLLVSKSRMSSIRQQQAKDSGVTVIHPDDQIVRQTNASVPHSYVSWLFNDWAWRATVDTNLH
ncbi:MAG TPA: hypothetical protein VND01_00715 [Candidatus Acidoferrales bacterium]|nr:hypothetical protein [Candidatus Acidoferrales bacterium]